MTIKAELQQERREEQQTDRMERQAELHTPDPRNEWDFSPQPFNLSLFEDAFSLLGQGGNWKFMVPLIVRQILVWTALNLNFDQTDDTTDAINALLASTGSGTLDTKSVLNCLRKIRAIGFAMGIIGTNGTNRGRR